MRLGLVGATVLTIVGVLPRSGAAAGPIADVTVSPDFFNPTIGQKESIAFRLAGRGDVSVSILDRDLQPIRVLPLQENASGLVRIEWDGRDDGGRVVPDEAYSLRIAYRGQAGEEIYSPALGFQSTLFEPKRSYSMASGVLSYELKGPARVHLQAGQAVLLPDGTRAGPVLRTVVDREPRAGGAVAEAFDGFDVSGTIFLPSLRDFVVSVMTESLPANSIITVGNRQESFRQYAMTRRSSSLRSHAPSAGNRGRGHHQGLSSLEDHTPLVTLGVGGSRDGEGRVRLAGQQVAVRVDMTEADAKHFITPDTSLMFFLDERLVLEKKGLTPPAVLTLDLGDVPPGEHRVAVNWASPSGPVGVQAIRVVVPSLAPAVTGEKR